MIEFTIMMIGYKIFGTKNVKKQLYYFIVACLNFFLLYMTGCRTAFVATAGAMLVFLIINKNYRICSLIGLLCIIGGIYFIFGSQYASAIGKDLSALFPYLIGIITTSGLLEAIVGTMIAVMVSRILIKLK